MTFDSRHADELSTLLALESEGSFVAAARLLERHPTILSKRLSALEARLGVRLIERSTRQLSLTDAGRTLVKRLRQAADLIGEAEQEAAMGAAQVRGILRLAVPGAMGRLWLAPRLPAFLAQHPGLRLEVEYAERFVDVIGEGFDAAIRIGELSDSRLVAQRLGTCKRILCASPAYLERHGWPDQPQALGAHNCLGFTGLASHPYWHLTDSTRQVPIRTQGSLASNDSESLLCAAVAGVGILGAGDWLFESALRRGELLQVLPQWTLGDPVGVHFIRPSAKFASAATVALRDWLIAEFQV